MKHSAYLPFFSEMNKQEFVNRAVFLIKKAQGTFTMFGKNGMIKEKLEKRR